MGHPSVQWIVEYKDTELRDVWSRDKTWGSVDTWTMPADVRQVTPVRARLPVVNKGVSCNLARANCYV